jgi:hypothetical protein
VYHSIVAMEHRCTPAERRQQLRVLAAALDELILVVIALPEFAPRTSDYQAARDRAIELDKTGFSQDDLSSLARSVPDLFSRYKDWVPPLIKGEDSRWCEPEWFVQLERKLQPALKAAELLRTLGFY